MIYKFTLRTQKHAQHGKFYITDTYEFMSDCRLEARIADARTDNDYYLFHDLIRFVQPNAWEHFSSTGDYDTPDHLPLKVYRAWLDAGKPDTWQHIVVTDNYARLCHKWAYQHRYNRHDAKRTLKRLRTACQKSRGESK